jgi:hypothetical protein
MVPVVPKFTTLYSLLSGWARCQRIDVKKRELRGNRACLLDIDFSLGCKAAWLANTVLDGWLTPAQVIDHHTHVPLFASFLTVPGAFAWREQLLTGSRNRDRTAEGIRRLTFVESQTMRRCPTCIAEDRQTYGCAHWRLFHQWPVARHCVIHGDILETCCSYCRTPFIRGREPRLADDPCRNCGYSTGAALHCDPPKGYWPMLRAMYDMLHGESGFVLATDRVAPLWNLTPLSMTSNPDGGAMLNTVRRTLDEWNVESLPQLADELGENWVWFNQYERSAHIRRWPPLVNMALLMTCRRFERDANEHAYSGISAPFAYSPSLARACSIARAENCSGKRNTSRSHKNSSSPASIIS